MKKDKKGMDENTPKKSNLWYTYDMMTVHLKNECPNVKREYTCPLNCSHSDSMSKH